MEQLAKLPEYTENKNKKRTERKALPKGAKITSIILGICLIWAAGYFIAHQYIKHTNNYIDQQVKASLDYNKEEFAKIHQELQDTQDSLSAIQEQLALTGETIHGTDKTKQGLEQRMTSLDQQLNDLKGSLQKLEEAARAW